MSWTKHQTCINSFFGCLILPNVEETVRSFCLMIGFWNFLKCQYLILDQWYKVSTVLFDKDHLQNYFVGRFEPDFLFPIPCTSVTPLDLSPGLSRTRLQHVSAPVSPSIWTMSDDCDPVGAETGSPRQHSKLWLSYNSLLSESFSIQKVLQGSTRT